MVRSQLRMRLKRVLLQVKISPELSFIFFSLVGSVKSAHEDFSHAMVLDSIRDGQFIFKNTYSEDKKFRISVDHPNSPDEFFFVHIHVKNRQAWYAIMKSKVKKVFSSKN